MSLSQLFPTRSLGCFWPWFEVCGGQEWFSDVFGYADFHSSDAVRTYHHICMVPVLMRTAKHGLEPSKQLGNFRDYDAWNLATFLLAITNSFRTTIFSLLSRHFQPGSCCSCSPATAGRRIIAAGACTRRCGRTTCAWPWSGTWPSADAGRSSWRCEDWDGIWWDVTYYIFIYYIIYSIIHT
jgi:hypothetical protein